MPTTSVKPDKTTIAKALLAISKAVGRNDRLADVCAAVYAALASTMNVPNMAIALYDAGHECLTFPFFRDETGARLEALHGAHCRRSLPVRVIATGAPRLSFQDHVATAAIASDDQPPRPACKVSAAVPLSIPGQFPGALLVWDYRSRTAIAEDDLNFLEAVTDFLGAALERHQVQIDCQQSDAIGRVLLEITNAVHRSRNLGQLFASIHQTLGQVIDVTNFFIAMVDTEKGLLHFPYFVDTVDDDFAPVINFNAADSLTGLVVAERRPVLLKSEALAERRRQKGVWGPLPLAWMGAPLMLADKVIGVVAVQSYLDEDLYTHRDLELLSAISNQMALAIQRKRSEDALKESEQKLRQIYRNILDVYFELSLDGRILEISPSVEKHAPYTRESLIGASLADILPGQENKDAHIAFILGNESVKNYEVGISFEEGSRRIYYVNSAYFRDDRGAPLKLIGTMRDVTDKKQSEHERERSISMLKATLEATADGILVVDKKGAWVNFNRQFVDIWDIPPHLLAHADDTALKNHVWAAILDDEIFRANIRRLHSGSQTRSFDKIELHTGKILECYSQPQIIGEDIVGRVWSFRDITDQQRIETALKISEERLSELSLQTEQFSLAAASMISIRDEQQFFNTISKAIVDFSDYNRVLISLFKDTPPYRDIIAFGGVDEAVVDGLRPIEMPKNWYDNVFVDENLVGHHSFYVPHRKKTILNQAATIYGRGPAPEGEDAWHPEDNLFVRMMDDRGDTIGVISVDESKSGLKPNPETVRPLEIFSNLIAQIVILKKEQKERRKAELWASEQRLALMVEQSPLAVIEWNRDFEAVKWNLAAEQMFGYPAAEAVGQHAADLLVPAEVRPAVDRIWQELIAQQGGTHSINDNRTKDGRTITCEWHNTGLVNDAGEISGVFSVIQDITERRQAETELKIQKAYLEQLFEASTEAIAFINEDGLVERINSQFSAIFGYAPAEIRGRRLDDTIIPASHSEEGRAVTSDIKKGRTIFLETVRQHKDGRLVDVSVTGMPLTIEGRSAGIYAVYRDISSQKKAELEITTQKAYLEQLFEASTEAIAFIDANDRVGRINSKFIEIFGFEAEEVIGRSLDATIIPAARRAEGHSVKLEIKKGSHLFHETVRQCKDGSLIDVSVTGMPITIDGADAGVYAIYRDISSQKRTEEELTKAKTAAEEATRAKSNFLANMSHEIRTPMDAIIGFSHLAMETNLTPQQRDYQQKIHASAYTLLRLIDDILDFSKIEAGKLDLEFASFYLSAILEKISSIFSVKSKEKGIAFVLDCPETIPQYLVGDALRLEQVLINLTSNAVKFTSRGEVAVVVELVTESESDAVLKFIVRDTGIGMTAAQVKQLFQPFQQADFSITRKYGGTGLGLVICKRLLGMMGSEIEVQSTPGAGSQFDFTVRFEKSACAESERTAGLSKEIARAYLANRRILVAEDNETNRQLASELLEQVGLVVTTAANGREAVKRATNTTFDCILMDLQMPVMDGLTATREIRKRSAPSDLPILAMTANAMSGDREACLAVGMNDHIAKPIRPESLYHSLVRHIRPDVVLNDCRTGDVTREAPGAASQDDWPPLDGLNLRRGLRAVNGDRQLYTKLLRNFYDRHRTLDRDIATALRRADIPEARRLAHTAKGVAGTVGAEELSRAAAALEKAFKNHHPDRFPELMQRFEDQLAHVYSALDTFFTGSAYQRKEEPDDDTPTSTEGRPRRIERRIRELADLIDKRDADALRVFADVKTMLGPSNIVDHLRRLESALNRFDFAQAKQELEEAMAVTALSEARRRDVR